MSIYPVPIAKWYVEGKPFGQEIKTLKWILKHITCAKCGKPITWDKGWVMHAITWGYGEGWCSEECLDGTEGGGGGG